MTLGFFISVIGSMIAFVLIVWLLWRARSTAVAAPPKAAASGATAKRRWRWIDFRRAVVGFYQTLERAIRYVLARRDWRYRSSWLLLLGFPGDGKSSLAASISESLLRAPQRRDVKQEAFLVAAAPETQWHFLEKGILLDPSQVLGEPSAGAAVGQRWLSLLSNIDSLRPDRALDGVVWVISAARLLQANDAERVAMARYAYARVGDIQDAYAFALPIYVVVSQCDFVQGFSAFWKAQDPKLLHEMVGWSSPSIDDNGTPSEWVTKAFEKLIEGLRARVLETATTKEKIADVDDFFLFPQYMRALHFPLQSFMDVFFKPNVYEARAFCRGIFFTGVVSAESTPSSAKSVRTDVAFVRGVVDDKIFAEQRLAQRTQKGLLARNRLIRRLQLGLIVGSTLLALALPWSAGQVNERAQKLHDTVISISVNSAALSAHECLDQERVYQLIDQVSGLDESTRYLALPLSWVDRRISHGVSDVIATKALQQVVLQSMSCKLQKRIDVLTAATTAESADQTAPDAAYANDQFQLKQQLHELGALESNLHRFERIARPGLQTEQKKLSVDFAALAEYVYGKPLPASAIKEDSPLAEALVKATYDTVPSITPSLRAILITHFNSMAGSAQRDTLGRVGEGGKLLATLQEGTPPILPPLRGFNRWLGWVRSAWLLSTPADNPCARMSAEVSIGVEALIKDHGYDKSLRDALNQFDTESCYQPAVDILRSARMPSGQHLFDMDGNGEELVGVSPELNVESNGLKALADVVFMQSNAKQTYSCGGASGGWEPTTFNEVLADIREYQKFANQQNIAINTSLDDSPLFDRLARTQLNSVVQDSLVRNQRQQLDESDNSNLDATSQLDRQLLTESANLSTSLGPFIESVRQLRLMKLNPLTVVEVEKCAQNYASNELLNVMDLASSSHLYDVPAQSSSDDSTGVFDLGSVPVLQAYLQRQLARMQVLGGYAAPFVTLLSNSNGLDNSGRLNVQTSQYWGDTISEINRAVQFADPAGQAAQLDDFFLKQLATLSYANCASVLGSYSPPAVGNDFFSGRRTAMAHMAQVACAGHGQENSDLHFVRIAMLFNSQMAGRYPFGAPSSHEVSLAVAKAFFVYYAKEKPELEAWLVTASGAKAAQMKAFVDQLDAVQAFFASNLMATPQSAPLTVDVGFRALPSSSPVSNQLIGWTVRAGDKTVTSPVAATGLPWNFGDPVSVDMQWADRSRFTPLPDAKQSDLNVSGYHATYQIAGSWAFLRLLDMHKQNAAALDALDPSLQLLQFQVPVLTGGTVAGSQAASSKAQFYLTLKFSAADPTSKALVPLSVPVFPQSAPVF
jgi:type VI secretion system protein ImpL